MSILLQAHVIVHPDVIAAMPPDAQATLFDKLADFSPVLDPIGHVLEEAIENWFLSRGYGTWKPLAPATVRDKERAGFGDRPDVVRTWALFDALTGHGAGGAVGHKFLVSPDSIVVGAYGNVIPYLSRQASMRALVGVTPEDVDTVVRMLQEWLGNAVSVYADVQFQSMN